MARSRVLFFACLAACADLGGLAGGGTTDAALDGPSAGDASPEAGPADDGPALSDGGSVAPPVIAAAGTVAAPSGAAQQTHLVRTKSGRFFAFYLDDAKTSLHAKTSTDFAVWTPTNDLVLPVAHNGDGRNFSVAYAAVGATEVVHVSFGVQSGNVRDVIHARGVLEDTGQIGYGATVKVSSVGFGPAPDVPPYNGEAVIVRPDGVVEFATGWAVVDGGSAFNATLFTSTSADTGGAWTPSFTQRDIEATKRAVNAHQLLAGGTALAYFWEAADTEPDPGDVHGAASLAGSGWIPLGNAFPVGATQSTNDWCAAPFAQSAHVARWTSARGFETVSFQTTAGTVVPAPPSTETPAAGNGVVLVGDGTKLVMAVISSAPGNPVRTSQFDGKAWGAWSTLVPPGRPRYFLSGSSTAGHAALLWAEAAGGNTSELSGAIVF